MREIVSGAAVTVLFKRIVSSRTLESDLLLWRISEEFDELHGVDFIEGFPQDLNEITQGHDQTLLILDDLMSECSKDQRVSDLFTRGSHHKGISVLYLTQNLFPPGKLSRTISLNSHYFIIFKNPRIP